LNRLQLRSILHPVHFVPSSPKLCLQYCGYRSTDSASIRFISINIQDHKTRIELRRLHIEVFRPLRKGDVTPSPKPQAGGPQLFSCPQLFNRIYSQLPFMSGGCLFHLESDNVLNSCLVVRAQTDMEHMGVKKNAYRIFVRNVEGKKLLGSPKCRWEDTIKLNNHSWACGAYG